MALPRKAESLMLRISRAERGAQDMDKARASGKLYVRVYPSMNTYNLIEMPPPYLP